MADASHLERMGRELKCPICLSLFNSAVSLTCNHVFCNSCIEKSMKAASSCPVCKVPYRRREIRPAPHMDNLVSIYKGMEVASGVNIFITQNVVSSKLSGEDDQTGDNICDVQNNDHAKRKQHQRKGSNNAPGTTQRSSDPNLMKPSFPAKKRVQVSPHPTSESQMEARKLEGRTGETDRNDPKNCPVLEKDMPFEREKGEPIFTPFFWLRDEEPEKSTQQTDDNQMMYTPPDVPCFSDIKDSDDDVPSTKSPEKGACLLSNQTDFIDSEMFDWTQRPCSPELYAPVPIQIEGTAEQNRAQDKAEVASARTACAEIIPNNNRRLGKKRMMDKTCESKGGMKMSTKEVLNSTATRTSKRVKKIMHEGNAGCIESERLTYEQENNKDNQSKGKSKRSKKLLSESSNQEKNVVSDGIKLMATVQKIAPAHFSGSKNLEEISEESCKLKKSSKSSKKTKKTLANPKKSGCGAQTGKSGTGKGGINTEQDKVMTCRSHSSLLPLVNDKELSDLGTTRTHKTRSEKRTNSQKRVKLSVEDMSRDNSNSLSLSANDKGGKGGQIFQDIQGAANQFGTNVSAERDKAISSVNGAVLHKCNTSPRTTCCAFCQSPEESEASGILVHYLDGKLVSANQNERTNGIYVHKNCTEWAPNVYFEDDNVVNLETELSRSRRIRCSLCNIKGAALGCYEKSCRRSFHVPCARLTPGCRWDCENFVMLCPIHASCQLPNENPQKQSRQKRKPAVERKSPIEQKQATEYKSGSNLHWKSQKKLKNLVLCCSALTDAEKGIVTEFENSSGVMILKNWDSTVTHVIASTDDNGACRRTLKLLMGVLEGKWILSVQWIKACMQAGELVDEQPYEFSIDIHGVRDGPRLGRLRFLNKEPKLFDGYTFYFMSDFMPSYKGYLHDLIIAAGGKVLNRKPVSRDQAVKSNSCPASTIIIYSLELPDQHKPSDRSSVLNNRRAHAEALAKSTGAIVATNSWILNCIAGHKLQEFEE